MSFFRCTVFALVTVSCSGGIAGTPESFRFDSTKLAGEDANADKVKDKSQDGGGTRIDPPIEVDGTNLVLDCRVVTPGISEKEVGCNVQQNNQNLDLPTQAASYEWTFSEIAPEKVKVTERVTVGAQQFMAIYKIKASDDDSTKITLIFKMVDKKTSKAMMVSKRLLDLAKQLSDRQFFRLVMNSVAVQDESLNVDGLSKIEFKIDDEWFELYDLGENGFGYPESAITTNAEPQDFLMLGAMTGKLEMPPLSDNPRFDRNKPYDVVTEPLYIQFDYPKPVSLRGVRYNGGEKLSKRRLPTGFPDWFWFEVSLDGDTWEKIPETEIKLDQEKDTDLLHFIFGGTEDDLKKQKSEK
jgi:hypothetical protein